MKNLSLGLRIALTAASTIAIAVFVVVAVFRLGYRFELDWLESGMVEHVRRLRSGDSIYTQPSVDFIPFPYPPLFTVFGAALSLVFGVGFDTVRLVSIAATLATFWLIYRIVVRQTTNRTAAYIAVGTYAVCFGYVGGWFDVGKPDSLFLFFVVAVTIAARKCDSYKWAAITGALLVAAILSKQTAAFVAVPLCGYLIITRPRLGVFVSAVTATGVGLTTLVLNLATNGWFTYFVWEQLLQHDTATTPPSAFFTHDMIPFVPVVLAALLVVRQLWEPNRRWAVGLYGSIGVGLFAGAFTSRLHEGGYVNVLMPICVMAAFAVGLIVAHVSKQANWQQVVSLLLCGASFVMLAYNPVDHIPTQSDKRAGEQFLSLVRNTPGEVLVLSHPTYGVQAGKKSYGHYGGTVDIMRAQNEETKAQLVDNYLAELESGRFAAVVTDGPVEPYVNDALQRCYAPNPINAGPLPLEGYPTGPTQIWRRANC